MQVHYENTQMHELEAVRKQTKEEYVYNLSQNQCLSKSTSDVYKTGKPRNIEIHYVTVHRRN